MGERICGKAAVESLAKRFPQLYVAPAEGVQEVHRLASTQGVVPENASLAHFTGSSEDELREVETPTGPIEVLFLKERGDFETFLQIIGHKSKPDPIARTVGAITYRGLPDWGKVQAAFDAYVLRGGDDWSAEFARLAKEPGAFRSELIVISEGPYSNVPADKARYGEEEWQHVSREIRLHHECAHVVCRRTMPDDVLPVWDEVTADTVGLLFATGNYDASLAALFLGVTEAGYADGRLAEYLDESQEARIDEVATEVHAALNDIEALTAENGAVVDPFDFLLQLKRQPLLRY